MESGMKIISDIRKDIELLREVQTSERWPTTFADISVYTCKVKFEAADEINLFEFGIPSRYNCIRSDVREWLLSNVGEIGVRWIFKLSGETGVLFVEESDALAFLLAWTCDDDQIHRQVAAAKKMIEVSNELHQKFEKFNGGDE